MDKLEAVIFDFDGTLADVPLDFDFMKTKIAALGEVFLEERPTPGDTPALEWLEELVQQAMKWDEDEGKEFRTRGQLVITAMELDAAREGKLFDFTRPTFEMLRERGIAAGVITRNISAAVRVVFPEIEEMTEAFVPREIATRVKPDPAHLMQALGCIGARPERSLMVGDHPMDVQTAKNAGAMSAAVTTGRMTAADFEPLKPDFIAGDVGELMEQLSQKGLV
ncbi:HAD family hydrolase [Pseudodesulfovibrio sp. zrk46]|uniref:HAD family hydrolase n=1 Tax=Pseudodesulfovibrio sp. zrk46 TaxID=2725288 RepID=UPI00144A21AD|nr:HAD family hydrolase [Pseudodesulfovibrio sp. zrk46]QJB55877.1 HAD family hydrolase [Pseudodesulfovibrio sp. zrk46]